MGKLLQTSKTTGNVKVRFPVHNGAFPVLLNKTNAKNASSIFIDC